MIIKKCVPFPLQAGLRIGRAQLAGKNEQLFQKFRIFKKVDFSIHYIGHLQCDISAFSKICSEVIFVPAGGGGGGGGGAAQTFPHD